MTIVTDDGNDEDTIMKVGTIMTAEVESCGLTAPLTQVAKQMWEAACGAVPRAGDRLQDVHRRSREGRSKGSERRRVIQVLPYRQRGLTGKPRTRYG